MGLFRRTTDISESKLSSVIKNDAPEDMLVWKYPEENFYNNSTVVVMPGEKAVFVKNGQVQQIFDNGTYSLRTENFPFLTKLRSMLTGGVSVFSCTIFFIRNRHSEELKWGTQGPINVRDKVYGIFTSVRMWGVYRVSIKNPAMFLDKMAGSTADVTTQEDLEDYFRDTLMGIIVSSIASAINNIQTEIIGLESRLIEFSASVKPLLNTELENYGISCVSFTISGVNVDTSKYETLDASRLDSMTKMQQIDVDRYALDTLGANWDKVKSNELKSKVVDNIPLMNVNVIPPKPPVPPYPGIYSPISMYNNVLSDLDNKDTAKQENASQTEMSEEEIISRIKKLKALYESDCITEEEFEEKRKELLSRL